jgi:flagellar L-ring protein precursor FlgH
MHISNTAPVRLRNAVAFAAALLAFATGLGGCSMVGRVRGDAWDPAVPEPLPARPAANGGIYQSGYDVQLFENSVAHRIGDILTIRMVESTDASKSTSTTTKKASTAAITGPTVAGRPITIGGTEVLSGGMDSSTKFDGSGASKQSNSLNGTVSVTVVQRLDNGNLVVRGEKWITINQGREFVRLSGIIRPVDIDPDNSIASSKVANARIAYSGKGAVADSAAPGLLARFFNSSWMPF